MVHRVASFRVFTNILAVCVTVIAASELHSNYSGKEKSIVSRAMQIVPRSTVADPETIDCPLTEESTDFYTSGFVKLNLSGANKLCTLIEVTPAGYLKPMGRSYDTNDWEPSAGDYSTLKFECILDGSCSVNLPTILRDTARYQLTSFSAPSYSSNDIAARFLEQATFGPTLADISTLDETNLPLAFAKWIKNQQSSTVPFTSHREYYRRRMNARFEVATPVGAVTHPCQVDTRYRRFAFSVKDSEKIMTIETAGTKKLVSVDGFVRTVVDGPIVSVDGDVVLEDGRYMICTKPRPEHLIGGAIAVEISANICTTLSFNHQGGNPSIEFPADRQPNVLVSIEDDEATPIDQQYILGAVPSVQELLVVMDLADAACSVIGEPGNPANQVVAFYKGEYWIHDPRFETFDNTIHSPAEDGGGTIRKTTSNFGRPEFSARCANAPQTFLNDGSCILSDNVDVCGIDSDYKDIEGPKFFIPIDHGSIRAVYGASGAGAAGTIYLYAVDGLRIADDIQVSPPCQKFQTSRWAPVACSTAAPTTVKAKTKAIFADLISVASATNTNPNVLDVTFDGPNCNRADRNKVGFKITDTSGNCWLNVHPNHLNVYDFTPWVRNHPGNSQFRNPIKEFADWAEDSKLFFPSWHEMDRWHSNKRLFGSVGRLGDSINYYDVPVSIKTPSFNEAVGFDPTYIAVTGSGEHKNAAGTLVCGSVNEVGNDAGIGGSVERGTFDAATQYLRTTAPHTLERQKRIIWTQIALEANDQLRQRVAWALAQILVVSSNDIADGGVSTEIFTTFYDIFVRHAFGNYRDVLREVSYNPLMSEMLTYLKSKSTAFVWQEEGNIEYADENYAREVMQLFTTGLYKLERNGNKVLNQNGDAIQAYTNEDIIEYARVWTGFKLQLNRGNKEMDRWNRIDPMQIEVKWRDPFPKMGLDGKYIGDGTPLCADLPTRHFLVKGAVYRLLGSKSTAQLQQEPVEWAHNSDTQHFTLQTAAGSNSLFAKLCGSINSGDCQFASKVVLNETLLCTDKECSVDTVRTVQVADGIFYEYLRPPCVYQAFYADAKLVVRRKNKRGTTCADPRTQVASSACCPDGKRKTAFWEEQYWGERSSFATTDQRCNQKLCEQTVRPSCVDEDDESVGIACKENNVFWTSNGCNLRVKIDSNGNAAIVHSPFGVEDSEVAKHVQEDTKTFFRLAWIDSAGAGNLISNCETIAACSKTLDGMCICDVSVSNQQVFSNDDVPNSSKRILDSLHIGSFEPSKLSGTYTPNTIGDVTWYSSLGSTLTSESVFQVTDAVGVLRFRKNLKSTVTILGTAISFRNPVHFIGLEDTHSRDAHYETEATLDTYFYHRNTAPFLATRFAQRFGISNPSPDFIERLVLAFQSGSYSFTNGSSTEHFGSQEYGDLSAMIACLLLDRETRTVVLDKDPSHGSLKEPLIKVIGLMRSMNFKLFENVPFVDLDYNIFDSIGQMAHQLPDVFSFFLPDYQAPGTISQSSLVAPEAQLTSGPRIINLLNGLMSLIKYGLDPCYDGFGTQFGNEKLRCGRFVAGQYDRSSGRLTYTPIIESADTIVRDLSTLMTAGRLSTESRETIRQVFSAETDRSLALIKAQQLIVTTPAEFHSTSLVKKSGESRPLSEVAAPSSKPYKAIVYVLLSGGVDSFNMLAPHSCRATNSKGATLLEQYLSERTSIAITEDERSRVIDATEQPCEQFVVHEELEIVERLYKAGDLAFFANAGVINKKATKEMLEGSEIEFL